MRQTLLAVMMLAVAAQTGTAWAFADDEARTAILELREQLKASQRAQVDLMGQVEALRAENQRMIGQMQELTRQVETMDKRLVEVEPARVELNGRVISVKPAERRDFEKAVELFRNRDFSNCLKALNTFKKTWPKSAYMADVDYWCASSYYALNNFKSTITVTNNLYRVYPSSPKAPEALLLKASAELSDGAIDEAKKTLNTLIKRYPKSDSAKTAKSRLAQIEKLG